MQWLSGGGSCPTYTAGDNITISPQNVISAVDTTYSAGSGISINSSNQISVDESTIQHKLTAGAGVTITDNVISATGGGGSDLPPITYADSGKCLVVDNAISGTTKWDTRLSGYTYILPTNTYSHTAVPGWSWTQFQSSIDANVAAGIPQMLIRKSSSNHPAGETAFYYHAIHDSSLSADGWVYLFGTVAAHTKAELDYQEMRTASYVTYKFYEGADDSVIVDIVQQYMPSFVPRNAYDYVRTGDVVSAVVDNNYSISFATSNQHEARDIHIGYSQNATMTPTVDVIWQQALKAAIDDKSPRLMLHPGTTWSGDQLYKRMTFDCVYADIDNLQRLYGSIEFATTKLVQGALNRYYCKLATPSQSQSTTIEWYKESNGVVSAWDPSTGF